MTGTDFSHNQPVDAPPINLVEEAAKRRKLLYTGGIVAIILLVLTLLCMVVTGGSGSTDTEEPTPTPTEETTPTPTEDPTPTEEDTVEDEDRIAYIKNGNVWVMNADGTEKTALTMDGDETNRYTDVTWKEPGIVSYILCNETRCEIYLHNVIDETVELFYGADPSVEVMSVHEWSPVEDLVVMVTSNTDGTRDVISVSDTETVVHSYPASLGRGIGPDDHQGVEFNSDGTVFIVNNTFSGFDDMILVFSSEGSLLKTINGDEDDGRFASFPTFEGDDKFFYRYGETLRNVEVASGDGIFGISVLTPFNGSNLQMSDNSFYVAYWNDDGSRTIQLSYYDVSGTTSLVGTGYGDPQWDNSSDNIFAIEKKEDDFSGFVINGNLAVFERTTGSKTVLESDQIQTYSVE